MNFKRYSKSRMRERQKKFFDIKITRDHNWCTIRMNQSYYLNEIFDELYMTADKHTRTSLFMSRYDAFYSVELNNDRINSKDC